MCNLCRILLLCILNAAFLTNHGCSFILSAGEDFECPTMTLTFSESALEQNVSIRIIDDVFFEGIEDFDVTLMSLTPRVQIAGGAEITINDNEGNARGLLSIVSLLAHFCKFVQFFFLLCCAFYGYKVRLRDRVRVGARVKIKDRD